MKKLTPARLTALLLLLISCFTAARAATVDIDGITYSYSESSAYVTYKSDGTKYSGDIVIPDTIVVDSTTYKVAGVKNPNVFAGCSELTSFTSGTNFIFYNTLTFNGCSNLKEVTFNYTRKRWPTMYLPEYMFCDCSSLESVTFPAGMKDLTEIFRIGDFAFYGCTNLKSFVNFPAAPNTVQVGCWSFYGCRALNPLEYIDLANVTFYSVYGDAVTQAFAYCNITSVTIPDGCTSIPEYTFYGCPLTEVSISTSVTEIGNMAFYSKDSYTAPELHEGLVSIGDWAFNATIENINIPASLESLGLLTWPVRLKSVTVAEGNKYFEVKNNALYQKVLDAEENVDHKILHSVIAGNGNTLGIWKESDELVTEIGRYAFAGTDIKGYDFPYLEVVGEHAFQNSTIENVDIKKGIEYGYSVFFGCRSLTQVTIEDGVKSLPDNAFYGCENLTTAPEFPGSLKSLGAMFCGCNFTSVKLHDTFESIDLYSFPRSVTEIECQNPVPPTVTDRYGAIGTDGDDWHLYIPDVTLTVPAASVELYKQHEVWGKCKEIIGNPDWQGLGSVTDLPGGLWFAQKGGNICYLNDGLHDTGIPSGGHPFQMQIHGNALYVADAGESHYYSISGDNYGTGDGQLYKVECMDNYSFVKTLMLVPAGVGSDYADPYTCFIDNSNGDIYASNRNQGVYKFNSTDKNWYAEKLKTHHDTYYNNGDNINTVSYFVKHTWLNYYGHCISYGALLRGFQRDSNGVNWMLLDHNGYGIYRFKDSDIHSDGITDSNMPYGIVLYDSNLSSMYIDEANGYLYVFSRAANNHGLYRIALSDISETENLSWSNANLELIDASPASPENASFAEEVYVRQITGDGKYIYWSYIAEEGSGYKSGIKMIPATGTPTVSYLIEDIEAYGLAVKDFDPAGVEQVAADEVVTTLINVAGNRISAVEDVTVTVYSTGGAVEAVIDVAAGETVILDNLTRGIHIVRATAADGTTASLKTVL